VGIYESGGIAPRILNYGITVNSQFHAPGQFISRLRALEVYKIFCLQAPTGHLDAPRFYRVQLY